MGRVVGADPERAGYIPENHVSWLCSPTATSSTQLPGETPADEAQGVSAGVIVRVGSSFSPGTPGDAEEELADQAKDFSECCLALAPGDVVEVAASGGGWVY